MTTRRAAGDSSPLAGIACLCTGLACFACQDAIVKALVDRFPVTEILMLRSVTAATLLGLYILARHGRGGFVTVRWRLHMARAALILASFLSFYTAVSAVPLAEVVALFSTAPMFITALSGPVLGERVGVRRWSAVSIGFLGVLVMLRPGSELFNPVALLGLLAALGYSASALIARRMGKGESSALIGFFGNSIFVLGCAAMLIASTVLSAVPEAGAPVAPLTHPFVTPATPQLLAMMSIGIVTLAGFVLVPRAYQIAPASTVTPFEYTYLLWAILVGYVVFGEIPSLTTLLGAGLVVVSGVYIARREAVLKRTAQTG